MKQEVFRSTFTVFKKFTNTLEKKSTELSEIMKDKDKFVEIGFQKKEILNLILVFLEIG